MYCKPTKCTLTQIIVLIQFFVSSTYQSLRSIFFFQKFIFRKLTPHLHTQEYWYAV